MVPPKGRVDNPADTIPARFLHSSLNKVKHPVNVVRWTPDGRRLITGSSSGEFTLWNGMSFNFETIMQAHDAAIRAIIYSHNDDWILSADHDGKIKYWQPNLSNVKVIQAHPDAIRDLAIAPTDSKFVTASDDSTLKIFDFAAGVEESVLTGHGWDAKCVDWHPTKGLLVSGSKDHLVKLWDPRSGGRCLTTLHGHKNTITKTLFNPITGNCLATSARDNTARIFDLRMMRDVLLLKGHEKDITALTWHPIHPNLLSTGGTDGSLFHYILDEPNAPEGAPIPTSFYDQPDAKTALPTIIYPAHKLPFAHDFSVWSLDWHPTVGHILASGSNDRATRFWTRPRPGDTAYSNDRFHIGEAAAEAAGTWDRRHPFQRAMEEEREAEDEMDGLVDQQMPAKTPGFPGIPGLPLAHLSNAAIPGMTAAPPPVPPAGFKLPDFPGGAGIPPFDPNNPPDFAVLQEMMKKAGLPPPPPPPGAGAQFIPPVPGMFPPSFGQMQQGFALPIPGMGGAPPFPLPGTQQQDGNGDNQIGGVRRRGPLPSQEESLQMEQRKGKYTRMR